MVNRSKKYTSQEQASNAIGELPPGVRPVYGNISFITKTEDACETLGEGINYFNAPDEDYALGNITGLKMAWECFAAAKQGDFQFIRQVVRAAEDICTDQDHTPDGRFGAAVGFIEATYDLIDAALHAVDLAALFSRQLEDAQAGIERDFQLKKSMNSAFLTRMTANSLPSKQTVSVME